MTPDELAAIRERSDKCDLGRFEYDMARYCHVHGGFLAYMSGKYQCDRAPRTTQPTGGKP